MLLLLITIVVSCKDENSGMRWSTISDKKEVFTVIVQATVTKDDHFSLYYTTNGTSNFITTQTVWTNVKGSAKSQKIVFTLPEKIKPTQLRIDLGKNQNQPEIKLSKIYMSYQGKMLELPGTLIFSYFRPDVTKTSFDATTGIISGKIVNGIKQSPSLYPKEAALSNKIDQLLE